MAKGARVTVDTTALRRAALRVEQYGSRKLRQVTSRAKSTLTRRLRAETARQVAEHQLNLTPRQISPHIQVRHGSTSDADYVSVTASARRLPLSDYKPRVSKGRGATVTTWLDMPPLRLPHAFQHGGSRARPRIFQRIPSRYPGDVGPSGLVHRLPIVQRKGPSLRRTLQPAGPSQFQSTPGRR